MSQWLRFFGFAEAPFSKDIDAGALWLPSSRKGVLAQMLDSMRDRGHVMLTGEPGIGKTCLLRALRKELPDKDFRLSYCHNATLGRRDFYRQLSMALGLNPHATAAAVFFQITTHVEELACEKRHPVFLLDEAHLLHQDVLDHLHVLTNYQWDQKPLLSLILIGLPELEDRIALRRNRSLYSRIHTRVCLEAVESCDTSEYIEHRCKAVGAKNPFSSDAVAILHEVALGRLREIDRFATASMKSAARKQCNIIDRDIVKGVIDKYASVGVGL